MADTPRNSNHARIDDKRHEIWSKGDPIGFLLQAMHDGTIPDRNVAGKVVGQIVVPMEERIKIATYLGNKVMPNLASHQVDATLNANGSVTLNFLEGVVAPGMKTIDAEDAEVIEPEQIEDQTPVTEIEPEPEAAPTKRRRRRGDPA